jgi:hypothetical protein
MSSERAKWCIGVDFAPSGYLFTLKATLQSSRAAAEKRKNIALS